MKKAAVSVVSILAISIAGMFLGAHYAMQWLQTASVMVMIGGVGVSVGALKNIAERKNRSHRA